MLKRQEIAVLINIGLENTSWNASRIARFLSTPSPDNPRPPGASATWVDVYDDVENTIGILAHVTKVCSSLLIYSKNINPVGKASHIL